MLKIGIIGAGKVGTALAILLAGKGYDFVGATSLPDDKKTGRRVSNLHLLDTNQAVADRADLVFITTPDDTIAGVVAEVKWRCGQSVVHCSGADSVAILEPARKSGAKTGAFHPLQTFAEVKQAVENIPGSTFAIEAIEPLLTMLKKMAEDLGGNWITLKAEDKAAYHAAAMIACNGLVTLVKLATDLWQTFSIPKEQATKALLPLLRGTIHNIETIGLPGCLTGPIARGDSGTINKHLKTIKERDPGLLKFYRELGLQMVPIAAAKGTINDKQAKELDTLLKAR